MTSYKLMRGTLEGRGTPGPTHQACNVEGKAAAARGVMLRMTRITQGSSAPHPMHGPWWRTMAVMVAAMYLGYICSLPLGRSSPFVPWMLPRLAVVRRCQDGNVNVHRGSRPLAAVHMVIAPPPLDELKVYELKAICKARGLKVSGRKAELVDRIMDDHRSKTTKPRPSRGAGRSRARGTLDRETAAPARPPVSLGSAPAALALGDAGYSPARSTDDQGLSLIGGGVEVLDPMDTIEEDIAERRRRRRQRLKRYFAEEMESISEAMQGGGVPATAETMATVMFGRQYGEDFASLRDQAGDSYHRALASATDEVAIGATDTSLAYSLPPTAQPVLAWCKAFDSESGRGLLVDLESKTEFAVARSELVVQEAELREEDRILFRGEFVEVLSSPMRTDGGAGPRAVQGLRGWPLMCEAAHIFEHDVLGLAATQPSQDDA